MLQLWLELARTFLALQQTGDARYCVQQAKSRAPGSPATHHMEGRVCQVTPNHCLHHHFHFIITVLISMTPIAITIITIITITVTITITLIFISVITTLSSVIL